MTLRARRVCAAIAALPLVFGVAACSSNSATPGAAHPQASGGSTGPARVLTAADFVPRLVAAQNKAGSAHLDGSITAGSTGKIELAGDLRLGQSRPGAHLTLSTALLGQGIEAILLDKTVYVKIPGMSSSKPWLKMSLSSGPFASSGLGALNLGSVLKGMQGALSVKPKGQESVDGVATTHYFVTVDAAKALTAQGLGSLAPTSGKSGTVVYELWVDNSDLIRKLALNTKPFAMQLRFSSYGSSVAITAPPAAEIGTSPF